MYFVCTFLVSIGTKAHYKFRETEPWAGQDSGNFSGHPYIGRVVVFAIAQLSLFLASDSSEAKTTLTWIA